MFTIHMKNSAKFDRTMKPKLQKYCMKVILLHECLLGLACMAYMKFDKFKYVVSNLVLKYDCMGTSKTYVKICELVGCMWCIKVLSPKWCQCMKSF